MSNSFKARIKAPNQSRVIQANKRMGAIANAPRQWADSLDAENFNFSVLNQIFYGGRRDRIQRYDVYDAMDMDSDIHRALDIIAEHCTQKDAKTKTPFQVVVDDDTISHEDTETIFEMLKIWNRQCNWDNQAFRTIRNIIKYGDFFFIRDENFTLYPTSPRSCAGAYVDDETGEIQAYHFTGLKKKFNTMLETQEQNPSVTMYKSGRSAGGAQEDKGKTYSGVFEAKDIIHLSMSEGMEVGGNGQNNDIWPFGESILERIYKDFKARSLLEEAEVIHRIQRAPSRRVFYIDVGKTRPDKAESYARKVKNELQQKRIPSSHGGQQSVDSVYNPVSQMEDLFLTVTADGRGTKVENLEGQAWTDEGPLKYFYNKVNKGLGVPTSYMAGPEDGGSMYNDGRVGTAYLQEYQFSNSCVRIQDLNDNYLDKEFKLYLEFRGIQIHSSSFELKFIEPMNFAEYRENALNDERLNHLQNALGIDMLSKRFSLKKFGNFSDDEILENEHLWMEENMGAIARQYDQDNELGGMGVGLSGMGGGFTGMDEFGGPGMDEFGDQNMGMGPQGGMGGIDGGMGAGAQMGGMGAGGGAGGGMGMENYKRKVTNILQETVKSLQYTNLKPEQIQEAVMNEIQSLRDRLSEEDVTIKANDLIAIPNKPEEKEVSSPDRLFGGKKEEGEKVRILDLSYVRKLRLERERNRKELIKRLFLMQTIYKSASDQGGGMGF